MPSNDKAAASLTHGMKVIGSVDDACPYCSKRLTKRPQKKAKCPHCGKFIFVRTRPTDRERVLVTENQVEEIEAQWNEIHSVPAPRIETKKGFNDEKKTLTKKFGREPSDYDVIWGLLNKELVEHSRSVHWGLYRNTLFEMGELLRSECRFSDALSRYFEVCYFDLNGPNNYGDISDDPELYKAAFREVTGRELKPFDPDIGELYPGILVIVRYLIKKLEISLAEARTRFLKVTERLEKTLRLPLSPEIAWKALELVTGSGLEI